MATFVGLPSLQHHTGPAVLSVARTPPAQSRLQQNGFCTTGVASAVAVSTVASLARVGSRRRRAQGRVTRHFFGGGETPKSSGSDGDSVYDFTVKDIDGNNVALTKYEGKVLLIVNIASKWGLTAPNYAELCELYGKYSGRGFEVLAFPCNQFNGQEPGSNSEIKAFAQQKCPSTFPLFDKIDVNGENAAPLYTFLKNKQGGGLFGDDVLWNFAKFLVNRKGEVVARFGPQESPLSFEDKILQLI